MGTGHEVDRKCEEGEREQNDGERLEGRALTELERAEDLREPEGEEKEEERVAERGGVVYGDECGDDDDVEEEEHAGQAALVLGDVVGVEVVVAAAPDDKDQAHLDDGEDEELVEGDEIELGEGAQEEEACQRVGEGGEQIDRRDCQKGEKGGGEGGGGEHALEHLQLQHALAERDRDEHRRVNAALQHHVVRVYVEPADLELQRRLAVAAHQPTRRIQHRVATRVIPHVRVRGWYER